MPALEYKRADDRHWEALKAFYLRNYRQGHPLSNRAFWRWQLGDADHGGCYVCLDGERVTGQVCAVYGGGYAWIVNVVLDPSYRGRGVLRELYHMAAEPGRPLAATNVNRAGLGMYRKMGWIRYCNLQRFCLINPKVSDPQQLLEPRPAKALSRDVPQDHYWRQPGLEGAVLADGTTAVDQLSVGGLRLVEIADVDAVADLAWAGGAQWIDYITSWNDPLCRVLEDRRWSVNHECPVPWDLNPVNWGSTANISFLAKDHVDRELIVKRTYSDHGRVGSLPSSD